MGDSAVFDVVELGFPWRTFDPFLFCVHHLDLYPMGNDAMGPNASLAGRDIGMDFAGKDGWRMYHGDTVPGFPRHPHRGFETVTLARQGYIDHSDSLGATARFGHGDVQWMTAGRGIVHAEMFPLVRRDADNPTELFQIWLNLPASDKLVEPHFSMLWAPTIPKLSLDDGVELTMVAGAIGDTAAPPPPPSSWASRPESDVAIWTIRLPAGARFVLPACGPDTGRTLYFFSGKRVTVDGTELSRPLGARLEPGVEVELQNGEEDAELLLLQGKPIAEPVAHYGPFVMNTPQQLQQAMIDYRRTGFGGWPWKSDGPVHARDEGRFAVHADGRREQGP